MSAAPWTVSDELWAVARRYMSAESISKAFTPSSDEPGGGDGYRSGGLSIRRG